VHQPILSKTFVDFLNACRGRELTLITSMDSPIVIQGVLIDFDDTRFYLKDSEGLGCWMISSFCGIEVGDKVMEVIDPSLEDSFSCK
jgi:hypothetical protein